MYALVLGLLAPAAEPTLEARVAPLVKEHKGKVAVAVKHLGTGESFYLNADEVMPTASLIKLPIMVEAYAQQKDGKIKFDTKLTLTKADKVPGSGILTQHFSDGATFPVRDAVRLMITFSDNTATNMVLDQTGLKEVNARMAGLGFKNTKVNAQVYKGSTTSIDPAATKQYGLGSTTAREMLDLLALIESGKVVSPEACKEMLAHLKTCDDKDMFARHLPAGATLAHKSGAVSAARTEAGIAYLKAGPVALCVLTNDNDDKRWSKENAAEVLLANVAKEVYAHFGAKK
jgi:beta-lactamase class A